MKIWGKKIKCLHCNTKFYDFKQKDTKCPKCSKSQVVKSKTYKKTDTKKILDLFYYDGNTKIFSEQNIPLTIDEKIKLKLGWYIIELIDKKKKIVKSKNEIIFLEKPPLYGLQQVLAGFRFPGIGNENSNKIINHPDFSLQLLSLDAKTIEDRLNLSHKIASTISITWKIKTDEIILEVILKELSFTNSQIKYFQDNSKDGLISLINSNPSDLLGYIPRVNFEQLNNIYKRLSLKPTEKEFAIAASRFWLSQTEDRRGHTCAPEVKVKEEASRLSNLSIEKIQNYLDEEDNLFFRDFRFDKKVLSSKFSYQRDKSIVDEIIRLQKNFIKPKITNLLSNKDLSMPDKIKLSKEQILSINRSLKQSFSIITGGPGSGKSTLIVGLVESLRKIGKKIVICAPTGRAAKRLTEYKELRSLEPTTIHMHLTVIKNKLKQKYDTIIIDEASMVDINLFLELIQSIPNGSNIILVGDADQLPPIGPGQPFKDMIESKKVNISKLSGNFRQNNLSNIIKASRSIITGKLPSMETEFKNSDFIFIECSKSNQKNLILNLFFEKVPTLLKNKQESIQILSPMHKGNVGIKLLNYDIQQKLTSNSEMLFERKDKSLKLFGGDKVIQTSNNYDLMVMNGDIGHVSKKVENKIIVNFDNREVEYSGLDLYDLDLAYAISIHKSQGSEYSAVIIPINSEHIHMLSRNLLYTAITRGKKLVVLVGEKNIFENAINAFWKDTRYTNLVSAMQSNIN